jgi:acetyltransferase-like isoleucine patch superfamily enzyme
MIFREDDGTEKGQKEGGMKDNFRGSVQKELIEKKGSFFSKYSTLFLGEKGFFPFLRYECVTLLFSGTPGALGFFLRKVFYPSLFKKVGKGVVFGRNITVRHPKKISIGDNTFIDDIVVLDAKGEENQGITIGANVYIGRNTILSCKEGSIFLEDYCNISANCMLLSETEIRLGLYCFLAGQCYLVAGGNHAFDDISVPIMFQPSYSKGGITVGEDVWLGAGVIVLDGANVGKGTIVGAGAVVTESLPEYCIAVGSPAQKIRDRKTAV